MTSAEISNLARIIWDYHHVHHRIDKADIIFVLGSHDLRVADYAAKLFLDDYAPQVVFSGGIAHKQDLLETPWEKPEAEIFAKRAVQLGVPETKILLETQATNCGENVRYVDDILKAENIPFASVIAVQKPYMERRTYATIKIHWPDKEVMVTSPPIDFDDYHNSEITKNDVINIIVGDLQRIRVYPQKGFQIHQDIPSEVENAYEQLVQLGYTRHLLKDESLEG